jgi:hypothetical protein
MTAVQAGQRAARSARNWPSSSGDGDAQARGQKRQTATERDSGWKQTVRDPMTRLTAGRRKEQRGARQPYSTPESRVAWNARLRCNAQRRARERRFADGQALCTARAEMRRPCAPRAMTYVARSRPISLPSARWRENSAAWSAVVALIAVVSESSVSVRSSPAARRPISVLRSSEAPRAHAVKASRYSLNHALVSARSTTTKLPRAPRAPPGNGRGARAAAEVAGLRHADDDPNRRGHASTPLGGCAMDDKLAGAASSASERRPRSTLHRCPGHEWVRGPRDRGWWLSATSSSSPS